MRFGAFELDVHARELRSGADRVRLQDQPFEILRLLLSRPGDVVTRDELRRGLWPDGTFVDFEHSLNAAVKRLRQALGDDADNPRFIETLPRRGYRFIGARAGSETAASGPPQEQPRVRLAVLPFSNLSDEAQDYFSDGLTEEMISQLGSCCEGRIGVLARWSSMVFKHSTRRPRDIGEALNADFLLEGSVRREGEAVRITARLVSVATETYLWSESFDRHMSDCLAVQAEVARKVARAVMEEVVGGPSQGRPRMASVSGYQAYLKGRYHWNLPGPAGLDQAMAFYEEALRDAPDFGAAHAAVARAWVSRAEYYVHVPQDALAAARRSATRALEIDPGQHEALLALADSTRMLERNWDVAERWYRKALAMNPNFEATRRSYGAMLSVLGRHEEAIRESERACVLDPFCLVVGVSAARVRYAAGDYEAAIQHCRNTLDMQPDHVPARLLLGAAYLQSGESDRAIAEMEAAGLDAIEPGAVLLSWLAHANATAGARAKASALLAQARAQQRRRYVSSYHLAIGYAGLLDRDAALLALETAAAECDPAVTGLAVEPRFGVLHGDERFRALVSRLHLPALTADA